MIQHALKEWAVTVEALREGHQVLIVRKGGIGEKRFELPHRSFYLFPAHEHQRPELVSPPWRRTLAEVLARREDPARPALTTWAQLHAAHPIADPEALTALDGEHILTPDYAAERLRWRPKHPLWAVILRVWRVADPPRLEVGPEHAGCVSWIDLPAGVDAPTALSPALDDERFARAAERVESILSAGALR